MFASDHLFVTLSARPPPPPPPPPPSPPGCCSSQISPPAVCPAPLWSRHILALLHARDVHAHTDVVVNEVVVEWFSRCRKNLFLLIYINLNIEINCGINNAISFNKQVLKQENSNQSYLHKILLIIVRIFDSKIGRLSLWSPAFHLF